MRDAAEPKFHLFQAPLHLCITVCMKLKFTIDKSDPFPFVQPLSRILSHAGWDYSETLCSYCGTYVSAIQINQKGARKPSEATQVSERAHRSFQVGKSGSALSFSHLTANVMESVVSLL